MDFGVIVGLLLGTALLAAGVLTTEGGRLEQFSDLGSIFVTLGGTICATLVQFPLRDIAAVPRLLWNAIRPRAWNLPRLIAEFRRYAEIARRHGILALEAVATEIADPFLKRGIQLAVDGTDPRVVEDLMRTDLDQMIQRHDRGIRILKAMAMYAPGFGMIGTLLGLVIMLQNLRNPDRIGPAMGLAIITTLYGAVMAYLVLSPLAEKLTIFSKEEERVREMVIRGVMGLQSGDNPAVLEQKLLVYAPPGVRA
jgi:chemotaxis protein MotA